MNDEIIEIPIDKLDWEATIKQNENLIKNNQIQIIMASEIIRMIKKKISEIEKAETPSNA